MNRHSSWGGMQYSDLDYRYLMNSCQGIEG